MNFITAARQQVSEIFYTFVYTISVDYKIQTHNSLSLDLGLVLLSIQFIEVHHVCNVQTGDIISAVL